MAYPAHHVAVGMTITVAGSQAAGWPGLAVAGVLAFASHLPLDWLNERSYGPLWGREWFIWDGLPMILMAVAGLLSGHPLEFLIGGLAGVGMDLIDKTASKIKTGDWFREPGFFHKHNKPRVEMTEAWTKGLVVTGLAAVAVLAWVV